MTQKERASSLCGPRPDGVTRREFMALIGGAAGALLTQTGAAWGGTPPATEAGRAAPKPGPRLSGASRVYLSNKHTDARLPLGGIGTGNIEIGPDGQFRNWQLFNTFRDGYVPLFFVARVGDTARLLQTTGGDGLPCVAEGRMIGEYPVADLHFHDPALPVEISLSAFTPFSPLDTALSSMPLVCFILRAHNPTAQTQTVSLAAMMQNPIGYDAMEAPLSHTSVEHPSVGANVNTVLRDGKATILTMSAVPGLLPTVSRPIHVYTNANAAVLKTFQGDRPVLFVIDDVQKLPETPPEASPEQQVVWLEDAPKAFPEQTLRRVQDAVTSGATLILSGKTSPLVQAYRESTQGNRTAALTILHALLGDLPGEMPRQLDKTVGKGKVIILSESILDPADAALIGPRQEAYGMIASLAGADYNVPTGTPETEPGYGTMALATLGGSPTALTAFDDFQEAFHRFAAHGRFASLADAAPNAPTPPGRTVNGALASTVEVAPGATVEVPFLLAWHYPNRYTQGSQFLGNLYTQVWPDAFSVIRRAAADLPSLRRKTETFRRTFYDSTLPVWMLDCVSSQISTIRDAGVVIRLANGDIYGWEGSNSHGAPTCTHVWGYEQTLARLFPDLERRMRDIDLFHQQNADGGINNRTDVPSPPYPTGQRPFTDGHASTILKAYREVLNSSDPTLLDRYWPSVKRALEYLIARDAAASGGHPNGTLSDGQSNTYDNTIHGVNSFIGTYYLAALRAGEEMAKRADDTDSARRFRSVFALGRANLEAQCWNGEYYQQNLPGYASRDGEYGPGCLSDQVIGQWWAHQLGLGYVLPREHVRSALRAIHRYNWKTDFTNYHTTERRFIGGTDKGLLNCTWPKGGRPAHPIPYVEEVWTGVEYQVAGHMLYEGMVDEAYSIVKAVSDRYNGIPRPPIARNPWCEIEYGGHYVRGMASWSLLLALSGFRYDGQAQTLHFRPLHKPAHFQSFFTAPEGWGSLSQVRRGAVQQVEVKVVSGSVAVTRLHLSAASTPSAARVMLGPDAAPCHLTHEGDDVLLRFSPPLLVTPDRRLTVSLS